MERLTTELQAPAIDGPWRVDSYGAKLTPARNRGGFEDLRLIDYRAMAIYGSFEDPSVRELLRHSLRWAHKQSDSILTVLSDRTASMVELKDQIPVEGPSEDLLGALIRYGEDYADLLQAARLTWSPNGKYLVALLPLTADELSTSAVRGQLAKLLELAHRTVLRPLILAENPRKIPGELQDQFDWQAFIGRDQMTYFRDRYARDPEPGMASRITVGVAMDLLLDEARSINGLSYEPTAESLDRKRAIADEISSYNRFLEGLTDGS